MQRCRWVHLADEVGGALRARTGHAAGGILGGDLLKELLGGAAIGPAPIGADVTAVHSTVFGAPPHRTVIDIHGFNCHE